MQKYIWTCNVNDCFAWFLFEATTSDQIFTGSLRLGRVSPSTVGTHNENNGSKSIHNVSSRPQHKDDIFSNVKFDETTQPRQRISKPFTAGQLVITKKLHHRFPLRGPLSPEQGDPHHRLL